MKLNWNLYVICYLTGQLYPLVLKPSVLPYQPMLPICDHSAWLMSSMWCTLSIPYLLLALGQNANPFQSYIHAIFRGTAIVAICGYQFNHILFSKNIKGNILILKGIWKRPIHTKPQQSTKIYITWGCTVYITALYVSSQGEDMWFKLYINDTYLSHDSSIHLVFLRCVLIPVILYIILFRQLIMTMIKWWLCKKYFRYGFPYVRMHLQNITLPWLYVAVGFNLYEII